MYSLREFFKRAPTEIATGIVVLVNLALILDWIEMSEDGVSALNVALVTVLSLFYVKGTTTNNGALDDLKTAQDAAFLFGAEVSSPLVGSAEQVTVNKTETPQQ